MRKVIREDGGFGMPMLIQEGGALFGGSVTEASMWLDGNGDIHIQGMGECSEFVEKQIAETIAALQGNPDAKSVSDALKA